MGIHKKNSLKGALSADYCDHGRIRTLNPQSRNLIFYPIELRSRRRQIYTMRAVKKKIYYVFLKHVTNKLTSMTMRNSEHSEMKDICLLHDALIHIKKVYLQSILQ